MCTEFRSRGDGADHELLGHEAVGVIADAGGSARVVVGDRVVVMPGFGCGRCIHCRRGDHIYCTDQRDVLNESGSQYGAATYAEYLVKPDYLLLRIPEDVSSEHAAAAVCLLGPGLNALERMRVDAFDTLLVGGCGPVGLGAIIAGVARGAQVFAIERAPYRQHLAAALGAQVFDPSKVGVETAIRRAIGGEGASAAIETRPSAQLAGLVERLGRLAIVTWGTEVALPSLVPSGLTVFGCWHWNHDRDADRMWATIRGSRSLLDLAVTHRFDLTDFGKAMDVQESRQCGKVMLYAHGVPGRGDPAVTHSEL